MIKIIYNTKRQVTFEKTTKEETWFNNNCSDENLLKVLKEDFGREGDVIDWIQFDDGKYIGSELKVYFKV